MKDTTSLDSKEPISMEALQAFFSTLKPYEKGGTKISSENIVPLLAARVGNSS